MHPRYLKTFLAVARLKSFTRAAEVVHLAQSSVSDQIQSLEAELGTSLFSRSRSELSLTREGEALVPYAEEMLALVEEARAAVAHVADAAIGRIVIGALETIASQRLPDWLAGFQQAHAGIDLELKVAGSDELLQQLERGEIDIAFCFAKGALDDRLVSRQIAQEPLVLIAANDGRWLPPAGDISALAGETFVATEPGCVYRYMFESAFRDAGIAVPRVGMVAEIIGAIARLVAAGSSLALVPRLAVADALERGDVRELPWPGNMPAASLLMVWRRRRVQPPALRLLLDVFAPARPVDARLRHAAPSRS